MKIREHAGAKYLRRITSAVDTSTAVEVDIYAVITAYEVKCPARAHAIKKLLMAGLRGKGSELDDLIETQAAVARAIELQRVKEAKE